MRPACEPIRAESRHVYRERVPPTLSAIWGPGIAVEVMVRGISAASSHKIKLWVVLLAEVVSSPGVIVDGLGLFVTAIRETILYVFSRKNFRWMSVREMVRHAPDTNPKNRGSRAAGWRA